MTPPVASAVVLTRNRLPTLQRTLPTVRAQDLPGWEVVVVDNGSTDGTPGWLAEQKDVRVVRCERNEGFARAMNLGFEAARGRSVAFLVDDILLPENWARDLVTACDAPGVAAVAGILRESGQPGRLNYGGAGVDRFLRLRIEHGAAGESSAPHDAAYLPGGACLVRRAAFAAAGGFEEAFFYSHEDLDLWLRLRSAGAQTLVVPRVAATHLSHPPSQAWEYQFHQRRNLYLLFWRHAGPLLLAAFLAFHAVCVLPRDLLRARGQRRTVLRAHTWWLAHIGEAVTSRRAWRGKRAALKATLAAATAAAPPRRG